MAVIVTGAAQGLDALLERLLSGGEGGAADQLGGDELAFLGLDEDEMAAVVGQVASVDGLVTARHLDITGDFGGDLLRHRRCVLPAFHVEVGRPVQQHGGTRPGLRASCAAT